VHLCQLIMTMQQLLYSVYTIHTQLQIVQLALRLLGCQVHALGSPLARGQLQWLYLPTTLVTFTQIVHFCPSPGGSCSACLP
jgi:hypothetical protein